MSYAFYVYTDRAAISKTTVYSSQAGTTYTYNYGTGQQNLDGFADGSYLRFTAVPADGYEFTQWVYHVGSPSAATQYSTSNPFTYYGSTGENIYIAAEGSATSGGGEGGGGTSTSWTLKTQTAKTDSFSSRILFTAGSCYCIPITFTYSGKAKFYCDSYDNNSAPDMLAYLSRTNGFDKTSGQPTSASAFMNDDTDKYYSSTMSPRDFGFEYNVVAGETYYLFVREWDIGYRAGYINIYCVAPTQDAEYFEWSSAVAQGLPVKNVSHTEWDNFIDKIIEVLTEKRVQNQPITEAKYGYSADTTYKTMLQDCYLEYDSDLQGYPLTAKKFNVARFIIGSFVSTGISDKTSKTSKVLASDLIKLETCLKTWQG